MPKRVVILTEGGRDIGFGHITRCTSLYDAFSENGTIPEFVVHGDESVEGLFYDKKYTRLDWIKMPETLDRVLSGADIAAVDSYLAGREIYETISMNVNKALFIDDYNRIDYPKSLVLNGNTYAHDLGYKNINDVTYLLGCRYMPLRKEFWEIPEKTIRDRVEVIMITFGGVDKAGMTPRILTALCDEYPAIEKIVMIGKGFEHVERIKNAADSKTRLVVSSDASMMKKVEIESDIAVSAGGQTLYELARIGIPTVAVSVADNQTRNVKGLRDKGFVFDAGSIRDENIEQKIIGGIEALADRAERLERSRIGRKEVDGKGAKRIVDALLFSSVIQ